MLTIKKTVENNKATLAPEGRLDSSTAPAMESAVKEVLSDITDLTFDFEKLEYISSAGLRVLLSAQKVMDTKGKMKVTGVNEDIMDIFEITGFSDILRIES
jgi:anti-sigma B factor antagonist